MSNTSKAKYISKACQVECWYCYQTIFKHNFKTHTETVHPGKPVRPEIGKSDKLLSEALCFQMMKKMLGGFSKRKVVCHSFNKYMITI